MIPYLIDAHEDLAYNIIAFGRDYTQSAATIRIKEKGTNIPEIAGQSLLGWDDYQAGQVALVFGTLFSVPVRFQGRQPDAVAFRSTAQAYQITKTQLDAYYRLVEENPQKYRLVLTRADLADVLHPWQNRREGETSPVKYPVGIVVSMESAEGLQRVEEVEEWWEAGVRLIGPVWGGTRFCGGTKEQMPFTNEGFALLDRMAETGFGLDVAHMSDLSIQTSLDRYSGTVLCSHGNVRSRLKGGTGERQLTDLAIRRIAERDGVIGVVPFNHFLKADWVSTHPREQVTLDHLIAHIDAICQLTGSANHAAIGTDFDGLFGWPDVPLEINTIADMKKLASKLLEQGYTQDDVDKIFHGNWQRMLERILPS
jgi:membrane dipeptidase